MKLYLIPKAPAGSRWHRTQQEVKDEAKGRALAWEAVEVPTDQRGLIAFLNELEAGMPQPSAESLAAPSAAPEIEVKGPPATSVAPASVPPSYGDERCPRCKFKHKDAERMAEQAKERATLDGVCEWIDEAEGSALERLVSAVTARLAWLARTVS